MSTPLARFERAAANGRFESALSQLQAGKKTTHWMWYIFPQLRGLATSRKSFVYGIRDRSEAEEFLSHPTLGPRLLACCQALLTHTAQAEEMLGKTDAKKLQSSMTLFAFVSNNPIFEAVLIRFFDGKKDPFTLSLLSGKILDATHLKYLVGVEKPIQS